MFVDSARAHALQFARPLAPAYGAAIGLRVLVAFLVVAVGAFYTLRMVLDASAMSGQPEARFAFVVTLMVAFVAMQRAFVHAPMTAVGLRPLGDWTRPERLYFFQVVPLATLAFAFVFRDRLIFLMELHGPARFAVFTVITGILWGMVQEFLYRGWLQTELTRRFGGIAGLLAANLLFTFGPLHINYLGGPDGPRLGMLAAVFGIGLVFGIIYRRSGNLWIPAVLHGLWPLNMT
jgi:membrane protease YdiL (CAAX protease family)